MNGMMTWTWLLGAVVAPIIVLFAVAWVMAQRIRNYSIVDVVWTYSLLVIVGLYLAGVSTITHRAWVVAGLAALWSLRLGTHLLVRIIKHHPHVDPRYEVLQKRWHGKEATEFFWFYQMQGISMILMSGPFLAAIVNPSTQGLSVVEWFGVVVCLIGVAGEGLADAQAAAFKRNPANKGKICRTGLWKWSRHPNYFFESVTWVGFWLFACGSPWGWVTVFAPAGITYLLLRVTGIPLTEECSVKSKGEAYREYQRTTSAFIPLPAKSS